MTLAPLLQADPAVQVHAFAILGVVALTFPQLAMRKGTRGHRVAGWAWVILMLVACVSSFFVHTIHAWGAYSPIHLLSIFTLGAVALGIRAARRGDVRAHRRAMLLVVLGGLVAAGGFTLMPGRIMHDVVWGTSGGATTTGSNKPL
jgi:uncharacterized membrane protein